MNPTRYHRRLYTALHSLELEVLDLIGDLREDAGAAALRSIDRDSQDATADRELALKLEGKASGAFEVLELIQAAMPGNASYAPRKAETA